MRSILSLVCALTVSSAVAQTSQVTVLDEDFSGYPSGSLTNEVGAHTEYHYLRAAAVAGPWAASTFRSDAASQLAWRIGSHEGKPALLQTFKNKMKHTHPMLVAGDPLWHDYTVEVSFAPESDERGETGVAFYYRNDRCYYFFGVDGPKVLLKKVEHEKEFRVPDEHVLVEAAYAWKPGDILKATVSISGWKFKASIEGGPTLEAEDGRYRSGKVALLSDQPARFNSVRVTMAQTEKESLDRQIANREQEELELQAANPKMKLWKSARTEGFGVGRNLRFGDLNNDGEIDVLIGQVTHHGPKDTNSEVSCMTAMTFDGTKLWQVGLADAWKNHLTNDVAFQIHDLDGDGKTEVVYCQNMELIVADGATGETKYKVQTPESPANTKPPYNRLGRVLGDAMMFCDVRGTGKDSDIVLKDRYLSVWVFDDKLNLLWHKQCNTGHYPYPCDVDNDGKDEIMVGYTLFDDNGERLWTHEDKIQDHADGVAILSFKPGDPLRLVCAASDDGLFFADMTGNVLKHHRIGHGQNVSVADFRPDLPGLESVSINYWSNQGIVHLYDSDGEIYRDFEPCQHGSMMLPINWTGQPGEYFVLSPNVEDGGLFDGWGRRVLRFPADGHPDMCNAVMDITGDCRDEIVVWDPREIWVYTQDDSPKSGKLYKPTRNHLYNISNYQANVSLPGWSE
jgi:rhamnogalacturonan endolyase